jgi:acetoin utilization protein AcuB
MTLDPVTVEPGMTLDAAMDVFDEHLFRHLPVAHDGKLVGMLSDRDVRLATGWLPVELRRENEDEQVAPMYVREVMHAPCVFVTPDTPCSEVVAQMLELKIGAVPVAEDGEIVGMVTATNMIEAFCDLVRSDGTAEFDPKLEGYMARKVITLSRDEFLEDAIDKCHDEHIRHLPVVDGGEVIGMVSDRDIRLAMGREIISAHRAQEAGNMAVHRTPVDVFMSRWVSTINQDETLSAAGEAMIENRFSALPVSHAGQLAGIITQTDILEHFATVPALAEA